VAPVGDILAAVIDQMVERVPGFLQPRAEPALHRFAGVLLDRREGVADDLRLLARPSLVETAGVALVVAHPLPLALLAFLHDPGMLRAKIGVERDRAADAVFVERVHDAKDADAVAVVALGPHHHVGDFRAGAVAAGLLQHREIFDVGDDPERDMRATRPFQPRAVDNRRIRKRTVRTRLHGQLAFFTARPFRCATTSSTRITSVYLWCRSNRLTLCESMLRSKQHSSTTTTWKPLE